VNPTIRSLATALLLSFATITAAQSAGIYTCVDAKGRKITSDRPIVDCIDREQVELNPSGTVRRKVGPSLTAQERAAEEAKEREAAEERARRVEEKRRDHALLVRYPYRSVHDAERREALAQIDVVIKAAQQRLTELQQQRKRSTPRWSFTKRTLQRHRLRFADRSRTTRRAPASRSVSSPTRRKRRSASTRASTKTW
jgi:hypothetical protein